MVDKLVHTIYDSNGEKTELFNVVNIFNYEWHINSTSSKVVKFSYNPTLADDEIKTLEDTLKKAEISDLYKIKGYENSLMLSSEGVKLLEFLSNKGVPVVSALNTALIYEGISFKEVLREFFDLNTGMKICQETLISSLHVYIYFKNRFSTEFAQKTLKVNETRFNKLIELYKTSLKLEINSKGIHLLSTLNPDSAEVFFVISNIIDLRKLSNVIIVSKLLSLDSDFDISKVSELYEKLKISTFPDIESARENEANFNALNILDKIISINNEWRYVRYDDPRKVLVKSVLIQSFSAESVIKVEKLFEGSKNSIEMNFVNFLAVLDYCKSMDDYTTPLHWILSFSDEVDAESEMDQNSNY